MTIKTKYWGMLFFSIVTVYGIAQMLGEANMYRKLAVVTGFFLPGILLFHYFFIWFPRALAKSWSLSYLVKIIFAAVNECIIDQEIRAVVIQKMNDLLKNLGFVLDQRFRVVKKNGLPRSRFSSLDPIWRRFFIEAFSTIEQEIKDETIRRWVFNKIINYLNRDANTRYAKDILRKFIGNSKYNFLVN
ncbi:hypothetical protein [Desulfotomaculum sp. 1211_IL3151]|uniref:hypothetical protein n=1 Tax=Desulfotomaculum sp. 1211_IL3151 TaxID=3084055 RepID=UPI002FD8FC3A